MCRSVSSIAVSQCRKGSKTQIAQSCVAPQPRDAIDQSTRQHQVCAEHDKRLQHTAQMRPACVLQLEIMSKAGEFSLWKRTRPSRTNQADSLLACRSTSAIVILRPVVTAFGGPFFSCKERN